MSPPPTDQFRCWLHQQPGYLAPGALRPSEFGEELVVNPSCHFTWRHPPPRHLQRSLNCLGSEPSDDVLWVRAHGMASWWPFWANRDYRSALKGARPGMRTVRPLPPQMRRVLALAGVLVAGRHYAERRKQRRELLEDWSGAFRRDGYVRLSGLLHPFHIDALRKYYRRLIRSGGLYHGDGESTDRYTAHNESVSRFFHRQLLPAVAHIAGEPLKPSYTYVVSYQGGAELRPHVDREQCEFTLSALLDYPPEHEHDQPWPLCIKTRRGTVEIKQQVGEAVLFRGRRLIHFRPPLPAGYTSTSMLLHYVRKSFPGSLD